MAQVKKIKVDGEKIKMAIQAGIPLTITTYTLPPEMEEYINDILSIFLTQLNQEHMIDSLSYCVKELVNNAKKANTKRVYFALKKLDLNSQTDYEKGMEHFKEDTINNIRYYLEEQRKQGFYIKVLFQMRNNKIKIEIRNRAELTVFEYKRIHDKLTRAQEFNTVEQGMMQLLDDTEGAGLGLVIMVLILRKIGLTEDNFTVFSENGETINRIILPLTEKFTQNVETLSREFVDLIDGLPEFPENISQINKVINDPQSKMSDVAMQISNDVSLTGELLKLVNSASYALPTKCHSIGEAVKIVGLRGIRNLLFSIGSIDNLVHQANSDTKKLWDHSYQIAFYSYNLARNFLKNDKASIDDSFVCGLLHDMGKIIFENAHPDTLDKIAVICEQRSVSKQMFERMVAGVNHGEIGAMIAQKWNFPDVLVDVIRYHHSPNEAPEKVRNLTKIVYLADMFVHYSDNEIEFDQIDYDILKDFNLNTEEQVQAISNRLKESFAKGQEN